MAENAENILKHELNHKRHWDYIKKRALTTGKRSDIFKQKIETNLPEYVQHQLAFNPAYIQNAESCFEANHSLNELIADLLLQDDRGNVIDSMLVPLVRRCIE